MVLDKENKIAYLKFPADKAEVCKAKADGYEIIDEMFCPEELKKGQGKGGAGGGGSGASGDK